MNKSQIWAEAQKILKEHKAKAELTEEFKKLLAPKTNTNEYHPIKNGERYCRILKKYLPEDKFSEGEKKWEDTKEKNCASRDGHAALKNKKAEIEKLEKSVNDILNEVLDGKLSPEEGKKKRDSISKKIQEVTDSDINNFVKVVETK